MIKVLWSLIVQTFLIISSQNWVFKQTLVFAIWSAHEGDLRRKQTHQHKNKAADFIMNL